MGSEPEVFRMFIEGGKVMAVEGAGVRLVLYRNESVLPAGLSGPRRWVGAPVGWRKYASAACRDTSERDKDGGVLTPSLVFDGFDLEPSGDGDAAPLALYTGVIEREDGESVMILFDSFIAPSSLGERAALI